MSETLETEEYPFFTIFPARFKGLKKKQCENDLQIMRVKNSQLNIQMTCEIMKNLAFNKLSELHDVRVQALMRLHAQGRVGGSQTVNQIQIGVVNM